MKPNGHIPQRHRQAGISLIEIMVAMVISLLLILGVGQIYLGSKASYRVNDGLARVQEAGRFATELLARTIRMAGFQGCMNLGQLQPRVIASSVPANIFDPSQVVSGWNDANSFNGVDVKDGTDVLTIRRASPIAAKLTGNLGNANAQIDLTANPANIQKGDVLFITDCVDADIFEVTSTVNGTPPINIAHASPNTSNRLSKPYQDDALVMSFLSDTFFIGDTGRVNPLGNPIFALYTRTMAGGSLVNRPLLDGVEDMQVLYGEDTDSDGAADTYVDAGAVADFANVISVRLTLLINSVDAALTAPDTDTYTLLGQTVDPPDTRQLRKTFTLTATVRNRELRSPSFGS